LGEITLQKIPKKIPKEYIYFIITISVVITISLITILGDHGILHILYLQNEVKKVESLNQIIEVENRKLELTVQALENDHLYLEDVIKEKLGLIKSDEVIFQFSD
jgi:cell division protein FtsB